MKLGAVAQPLRAALTGRSTSPGVFDVLAVLGREESLARIRGSNRLGQPCCPYFALKRALLRCNIDDVRSLARVCKWVSDSARHTALC